MLASSDEGWRDSAPRGERQDWRSWRTNRRRTASTRLKGKEYVKAAASASGGAVSAPGLGEAQGPAGHRRVRGTRRRRQGRHDPGAHRAREPAGLPPRGAARARRTARRARCTCSATCSTSRRPARSSSSTAAGTTGPASSTSWASAPRRSAGASSSFARRSRRYIVDAGIILIKYWLEVGNEEQERRFEARITDPLRQWKLSPMDLPSRTRWYDYSRARDRMLAATDTKIAPWYIVRSDDKKRARLNCISHLLEPDPVQEGETREGQACRALEEGRVRRPGRARGQAVRPGEVLRRGPPVGVRERMKDLSS